MTSLPSVVGSQSKFLKNQATKKLKYCEKETPKSMEVNYIRW